MMYNYPFPRFPYFRRNYYKYPNYYNPSYYANKSINSIEKTNTNNDYNNTKKEPNFSPSSKQECEKLDFSCDSNLYNDTEYFNIFGFSLHIDDLLILTLLFFLYKEGIDDMYLYIALILLLFS